jgi:tape measure domain-containing protein
MNLFELSAMLVLEKDGYDKGLDDAEREAKKSGSKIDGVFNDLGKKAEDSGKKVESLGNGFTVMKGALANLAGNYLSQAIDGIKNLAGEAISSSDSLKKFESTMQFAGYDGKQIEKARDDMKEYADKTVYDLQTISNTTAQLAANGVPNYEKLTEAAGNLNAVAGGNSDTFQSVAMVLTQTAGAGKLTTENWNQLANAIPGASGKIQEALQANGAYTGEFRDAMAKGQITADEFNKAIMDLGFTDAAQQAATSTDTFEGAIGNLQAATTDGLMKIYDAIGSENITGFINTLTDTVSNVIPPIETAVSWFVENLPQIAPLLTGIGTGLAAILVAQKIEAMVAAFEKWRTATEGMTLAQAALNAVQLANPIGLIIAGIAALVAAFVTLWNTSESFRNFWIGVWDGIQSTVGTVVGAIVGFFTETLPNGIKAMLEFVAMIPIKYWEFLGATIVKVAEFGASIGQKAVEAGSKFLSNIISFISQLPSKIWSVLSNVIGKVASFAVSLASKGADAAKNLAKNIINGIKHLPKEMLNWGKDMIQGLIDGIKNMIGKVGDAVKGVADKIKNFLHFSRPDEGPLREYEQWMPDMIRGLTSSLDKASPSLINKVKDLASDMSDSLKIDGTVNAMSEFHQIPEDFDSSGGSFRSIGGGSTYIINVNQPVSTPDEMANAIRVESQYGLIEGVPI